MLHFPSLVHQVSSALIHFLGVTIITHCLSRRLAAERIWSLSLLRSTSWARICVVLIFLDSWCFIFSSGVLIFGAGLELHPSDCAAGIYICIGFYSTSKMLIYLFLAEKVFIVWQGKTRRGSPAYLLCVITISIYAAITATLLVGRIHHIREDGVCIIGLKSYASISLLSYDLYINIFLTGLFLWPICRAHVMNPKIRRVATRTLIAAGAALTTSAVNIAVLTVLSGQELGWVCLGSCALDVTFNAIALFWVSHKGSEISAREEKMNSQRLRPCPPELIGTIHSLRPSSPFTRMKLVSDPVCLFDLPKASNSPTDAESTRPRQSMQISSNPNGISEVPRGHVCAHCHHYQQQQYQKQHVDTMIVTPWTHLEIPTERELDVIDAREKLTWSVRLRKKLESIRRSVHSWREAYNAKKVGSQAETSAMMSTAMEITVTHSMNWDSHSRSSSYDRESRCTHLRSNSYDSEK